ncbi:MAG: hypothetical protein SVR04_04965 [Spirochaetota bacterium]|nr:hypothetical protein [Spirochaetota bacterium]
MKTCTEKTTIEKLLLSLQEARTPAEHRRIMDELSACIGDPRIFQEEPVVHYNTRLHQQSIIIWDAFESVTNGMYNPEALHRLEEIDNGSPFSPWKNLILAILAFYQGDRDNLFQLLGKIPSSTPPGRFRNLLRYFEEDTARGKAADKLCTLLEDDHDFISCAVDQLNDCLENNHTVAFLESTGFLVRDLLASHSHAARRLAVWSIQVSSRHDFDISGYICRLTDIFGRKEALRLVAVALMPTEPEISLLFWLRYGIESVSQDTMSSEEIFALIAIIADTYRKILEDNMLDELRGNREYTGSLHSLALKLGDETLRLSRITGHIPPDFVTHTLFPGTTGPAGSQSFDPYEWLENAAAASIRIMRSEERADTCSITESISGSGGDMSGRDKKHHPQGSDHNGCRQLEFLFEEGYI